MSISATALHEAEKSISKAWAILLKEAQSRKWDSRKEIDQLIGVINEVERTHLAIVKLETSIHGFDYWQEIDREETELARKRLANKHCKEMGLALPFPEDE